MRKTGSFVGGLGGQIILTPEDKCGAKGDCDVAKIEFDLICN